MALVVKNLPDNAGDRRDRNLISGLGRSPAEGNVRSSILAWRIPWTEEPGKLHRVTKSQTQLKRLSAYT